MISRDLPLPPELSAQLKEHFARTILYFSNGTAIRPEAVILGGGYGRGEGGVVIRDGDAPAFFNDLDYFIFTDSPDDIELNAKVRAWEAKESKLLGIDVEGKCLPAEHLGQAGTSMMFFDLVSAHTVVMGDVNYLAPYRFLLNASNLDSLEATRLLWNRGSGLLFARTDLALGSNLDVVHRNQSKAKLALGDAWLTLRGKYSAYVRDRQRILQEEVDVDPRIVALHEIGTSFKLRPTPTPSKVELDATQIELTAIWRQCFLEAEEARLSCSFSSAKEYADYSGMLFPDTSRARNLLLALRDRIKRGGGLYPMTDYPRGALQRALLLLLETDIDVSGVGKILGIKGRGLPGFAAVYQKWWECYS
jgi:hypothetical protein